MVGRRDSQQALHDAASERYYLNYRLWLPRGVDPEQGGGCFISESTDGVSFDPIWRAEKTAFESDSMKRATLVKGLDDVWKLYLGYVDPQHKMWCVDLRESERPDGIDTAGRHPLLDPVDLGVECVKDPYVFTIGHHYQIILSYATRTAALSIDQETELHATTDTYNTGLKVSPTGLATSTDGRTFDWQGDVFSPTGEGWDAWCRLICSLAYIPPVFVAFYDGASALSGNYEEQTDLAARPNIRQLTSLSPEGPQLVSPHATRCLRYFDAVQFPDRIHYYCEYAHQDGSHELRVNVASV